MLHSKFPGSSGIYDASLANTLSYTDESREDFIQIVTLTLGLSLIPSKSMIV